MTSATTIGTCRKDSASAGLCSFPRGRPHQRGSARMTPDDLDELRCKRVAEWVPVIGDQALDGDKSTFDSVAMGVTVEPLAYPISEHAHGLERAQLALLGLKFVPEGRLELRHTVAEQAHLGRSERVG